MAFDESVAAEALRLFDFLLERPCQPILESLILNNLQDRSYFLNYSPESMSSWSDEEDEREKIRRVSVSPTPAGSASVSSTPAPHSSAVTRSSPAAGLASGSNLAGSRTLAPGMVSNAQLLCNHLAILIESKKTLNCLMGRSMTSHQRGQDSLSFLQQVHYASIFFLW